MFGFLKKTISLGACLFALSIITPIRVEAQTCQTCATPWMCEFNSGHRFCYIMGPPAYECVTELGCVEEGGEPEQVAAADFRTLATPEGPHHVSRISGQFFGRWMACDGWVTELWVESEEGELVTVEPEEAGLLYHPDFLKEPGPKEGTAVEKR